MSTTADSKANGKAGVKTNGHKTNGAEKPQVSAFGGRTAFFVLAASVMMYAYQVGLGRRFVQLLAENHSRLASSVAILFLVPASREIRVRSCPRWWPSHLCSRQSRRNSRYGSDYFAFGLSLSNEQYAWAPYAKNALGQDEYHPQTESFSNFADSGSIGYTLIDALDSMQIMGLKDEYDQAYNWLATNHTFERRGRFNTFEVCFCFLHCRTASDESSR